MSKIRRILMAKSVAPASNIVVSDTFNRADGVVGNAETGQTWISETPTWVIAGNKLKQNGVVGINTSIVIDSGLVDCDITVVGSFVKLLSITFRYQNMSNHYRLRILENNTVALIKVVGGGTASLANIPMTITAKDYTLRVLNVGNSIKCYIDGVLVIDTIDNSLLTQTKQGLFTNGADYFDNYIVKTV